MKLEFPSRDFEDAVAAVCHGVATHDQVQSLNALLRANPAARDAYILRLELHSRLASDSNLFVHVSAEEAAELEQKSRMQWRAGPPLPPRRSRPKKLIWSIALSANLAIAAVAVWQISNRPPLPGIVATSKAIALLSETVNTDWATSPGPARSGAALEPGMLKLNAGLAEIIFYSGARVVIEGPAELQLVSASHAVCIRGRMTAEVPPQARGFRIDTPHGKITDLGTSFGLDVSARGTEVHVFKGEVTVQAATAQTEDELHEGSGLALDTSNTPHRIAANPRAFASHFEVQAKSAAADARRLQQWRVSGERLNSDASLAVRLDFNDTETSRWTLQNVSEQSSGAGDATIVACQWGQGRWPGKRALEFQNVSDRVRLTVPGTCEAMTMTAWVRVQGLDRKLNSLFMSDGFAAGSVHWLIRNDGVLGMTIVGEGQGNYQIATSPPVLTLDRFGTWVHLAVVVDGRANRVIHFVNGRTVANVPLSIKPPYCVGTAELGNWNAKGFPQNDPFMIRNFSGAMDEFCLFLRALDSREVAGLYAEGRPDAEILASR